MEHTGLIHASRTCMLNVLPFMIASAFTLQARSQSITNGSFTSGSSSWTDCTVEVNVSNTYGGPSSTDNVAHVNAGTDDMTTTDDAMLCQSITGFTVGSIYALDFYATRCQLPSTPATVTSSVSIDGSALETQTSRSGSWNMTRSQFNFTATQTTHALQLAPAQSGNLGMVIDDVAITLVSALPIELVYFTANPGFNAVHLEWATGSEQANDHFTVERGRDGRTFDAIAETPAAGNSQSMQYYASHDGDPLEGASYYRLRQTDQDGATSVSAVQAVVRETSDGQWAVTPNPANDVVVISEGGDATVEVLDATGRILRSGRTDLPLDVSGLSDGLFHVRVGGTRMLPLGVRH